MNNESKIACCNTCLLSEKMKDCIRCPFNPVNLKGLKPEELATIKRIELLGKDKTIYRLPRNSQERD